MLYHKRGKSRVVGREKSPVQLEKVFKSVAHHHRLNILNLLHAEPWLSVHTISQRLSIGYLNTSDHIRKLYLAGLVIKKAKGTSVVHLVTKRGEDVLVFCKKLK